MAKAKKVEEKEKTKETTKEKATIDIIEIKNDLVQYIDDEIEKQVDATFTEKVKKEFFEELDNANRRVIKEKNRRLLSKNIIIILLLVIIGYLLYLLYSVNYFDKFFVKESDNKTTIIDKNGNDKDKDKSPEEKDEPKVTLEDLKKEYAPLLNNVQISKDSKYLEDYYKGNLSEELKSYLALNLMNFENLDKEEEYNVISSNTFEIAYKRLFDDDLKHITFDYNGNKIRYFNKLDSYLTDYILEKDNTTIEREIIDIKLINDNVLISTVEGLKEDGKLYNILTKEEVENYNNDSLVNYQESLNTVTYKFNDNKLISIK